MGNIMNGEKQGLDFLNKKDRAKFCVDTNEEAMLLISAESEAEYWKARFVRMRSEFRLAQEELFLLRTRLREEREFND